MHTSAHYPDKTSGTLLSGAKPRISVNIFIDDSPLACFASLELKQHAHKHHTFTIWLDTDMLRPAVVKEIDPGTQPFLKQKLSIIFYCNDLQSENSKSHFTGIVTSVGFEQEDNHHSYIVLKGYSPTILLDNLHALHTQAFSNKSMQSLVSTILAQSCYLVRNMPVEIKPSYTAAIPYSCQYVETDYSYLCRLAARYGEWFYYDGAVLHFGKPWHTPKTVKLMFGLDVQKVSICSVARYNTGNRMYNDTVDHLPIQMGTDIQGEIATDIFTKTFSLESRSPNYSFPPDNKPLHKGATTAELLNIIGTTNIPVLHPGSRVVLDMQDKLPVDLQPMTTFLITETIHQVDRDGIYNCTFTGRPSCTVHISAPQ